jgi:hypothetical protein
VLAAPHLGYFIGDGACVYEALTKTHQFALILQWVRPNLRRPCDQGT